MDDALECRLRMEAWDLYSRGVGGYARQLQASGLSADRYSDGRLTAIGEHKARLAAWDAKTSPTRKAVDLGTVLRRSESIGSKTYDEATNTIECTWTSGASVLRSNAFGETFNEVLVVSVQAIRMGRLNAGAPLLNSHQIGDLSMQLGSVVPGSARLVGGKGTCRLALSNDPAKGGIITDIKAARIRNISVGYRILNCEIIDGRGNEPWTLRVTDWEPFEISVVSAGADPSAFMH